MDLFQEFFNTRNNYCIIRWLKVKLMLNLVLKFFPK